MLLGLPPDCMSEIRHWLSLRDRISLRSTSQHTRALDHFASPFCDYPGIAPEKQTRASKLLRALFAIFEGRLDQPIPYMLPWDGDAGMQLRGRCPRRAGGFWHSVWVRVAYSENDLYSPPSCAIHVHRCRICGVPRSTLYLSAAHHELPELFDARTVPELTWPTYDEVTRRGLKRYVMSIKRGV